MFHVFVLLKASILLHVFIHHHIRVKLFSDSLLTLNLLDIVGGGKTKKEADWLSGGVLA